MKRLLLAAVFTLTAFSAFSQSNQACFKDTSLIDELYGRKDTFWVVKPAFQKGDWNIYWDFALTKIKSEQHYNTFGAKSGIWKEYYKNGQVQAEWTYDGALTAFIPPGKEWYWNGAVKTDRTQTADSLFETSYFQNGKISGRKTWDKSGACVRLQEFCESGQIIIDYNPTSKTIVPVKRYYCDGKIHTEFNWYLYGYAGAYKEYHPNGKPAVEGQFEDVSSGKIVLMKTGTWTFYDDKGKVTKKEKWESGKLISTEK